MRAQLHRNVTMAEVKTVPDVARKKHYRKHDGVTHPVTPSALRGIDKQACMRHEVTSN
jgi:hypothetical protein